MLGGALAANTEHVFGSECGGGGSMVVIVAALGNGEISTDNSSRCDLWLINARDCRATGRGRIILAVDNLRQWSRTRKCIKVSDRDSGMINGMSWRVGEVYVKECFAVIELFIGEYEVHVQEEAINAGKKRMWVFSSSICGFASDSHCTFDR